ncbi:MAG: two-component regulator propeller domain-containing protein, partial [Flavobacteriales bacterium]
MLRNILLLVFGLLLAFAQASAQQYNFKRFSIEEGLPRSGVYCLLEDSRGFLWIGTEGGGLARFDGREFVTYTVGNGLPDNTIRSLFEDADGNIWFGTNGHGLGKFDGTGFTSYTKADGLSNEYVRSITQGLDGDIWIGTFGGGINRLHFESDSLVVSVFDKEKGTIQSDRVRAAMRDSQGTLWFGTDEGLCSTDSETWSCITETEGLSHKRVLVLYEDKLQNLWVGTQSGVNKKTDDGFVSYSVEDGLQHDRIRGITQDEQGGMWFGTQAGVTRFDGKNFVSFTEANGLSNDRIRYITSDRSGNLWFGTYFGGICRYSGEEFVHFTEQDGVSSNQVLSVFSNHDGDIWLGTLEGITELKPQPDNTWKIEQNPLGSTFKDRSINVIVGAPNNEIWFGSDQGIFVKNKKKITRLKTDNLLLEENVTAIHFEPGGHLWIGSDQGATRYEKTETGFQFNQYHSNANINESEVSSIVQDGKGRVWISYLSSQFVVYNGGEFITPNLPSTLKDVSALKEDKNGFMWIATEGAGLFKYHVVNASFAPEDFVQFGIENGLSSSDIHQLVFDADDNLWAGTASGVDLILLNNQSEVLEVKHYGMSEGFIGTETNENASCLDNNGNLWFGTIRGATVYSPKARRKQLVENLLHITSVKLGSGETVWEESEFTEGVSGYFDLPINLKLPYASNSININYNGIDLRAPDKVRYEWRLAGYNDQWSFMEDGQTIPLPNLPANKYVFEVRSVNNDGVWNKNPTTFAFTVLPPIWQTWWFITLATLLGILLIWGIVKLNQQRLLKDKERLQKKVDERTVELRHEKDRSDALLLNILPSETAEELKSTGYASVRYYERVSVLFTDFVGFTNITEGISHEELVRSLDEHFRMFDEIMDKYSIEKIKTIGDAYMAAGGIPTKNKTNPLAVTAAGLEMVHQLQALNEEKTKNGQKPWQLRCGIHTGSVISGVVGKNKFAFDIWGDAVNTAARMESSGDIMKVNISGSTYELVKDYFNCTPRGKIKAKNKGEI